MKLKLTFNSLLLVALTSALAATSLASATWYVDGVHGSNGNNCKAPATACKTIGHAISLASSGDSIRVAGATYMENITISFSLTILGANPQTTIIDGGGVNRVVTIPNADAHVTLSRMTIRGGLSNRGGGIYNGGTLAINNSTITGNTAFISCNGLCLTWGGIFSRGSLIINNSTVSGNRVECEGHQCFLTSGGGIMAFTGPVTINNSTLSDNAAVNGGGGIRSPGGATTTISNSTLSGNYASIGGGIAGGAVKIQNSIVANNTGGNCSASMTSDGYNLSSDNTCNFNGTGDMNNTDPMLGTLGYNGGPTETIPLPTGSPAIDAGNPSGCTDGNGVLLKTDQRGQPRPNTEDIGDKKGCDIGAYERQSD